MKTVQNCGRHCRQADEQDRRENDAGQEYGQVPMRRISSQNREERYNLPREDGTQRADDAEDNGKVPEYPLRECPGLWARLVPEVACEHWDERRAERPLSHHPADKDGNLKRQDEGVGGRGGPEQEGYPLIA